MRNIGFIQKNWLLGVIFVLAVVLRLYHLSLIPVGIHGDEASVGYNAYSLLKTLHDQNGNFLPLSIDQFGDFRPAGIHYLSIPFVAFFGLNEMSTRLPSALFGSLTIIAFYLLLFELFTNKKIALIGAALLAINPWHIILSRATSEGIVAAFFVILGVFLFLKAIKHTAPSSITLFLSFACFCISFLFYHSDRFFVPLFLIVLLTVSFLQYKPDRKKILLSIGLYGAMLVVLFVLFTAGKGANRPLDISLLNIPGGTRNVKQQQDEDGTQNPLLTRFFHNKLIYYGQLFITSYSQHFSGEFLFVNNGLPIRYKVPWTGNLYPIEAPFIIFGFAVLLTEGVKSKKYFYLLPVAWVFMGAIPAGLTWEDIPNIQRSSLMLYAILMMSAFGIHELLGVKYLKVKSIFLVLFVLVLTQNSLYFFHNYFYHSLIHEPWYRSAGEKELIFSLDEYTRKGKTLVMTTQNNNNLIFYLYYSKFDPKQFQMMKSPREVDGLHFRNLIYTYNPCPLAGSPTINASGNPNEVYVDKNDCQLPKNTIVDKVVRTPDGIPVFQIVKLKNE